MKVGRYVEDICEVKHMMERGVSTVGVVKSMMRSEEV